MTWRPSFSIVLGGLLALGLLASDAAAQRSWTARGEVREIREERSSITIHHEPVPGYMPEMTMPFDVADRALLDGIEVGDRVEFTFTRERDGRHTIHRLRVVERARESHSP